MFPSFAPKGFPLSQHQNGKPYNPPPHDYLLATIDDQTCELDFEDILDNHQLLTDQSSFQECTPTQLNINSISSISLPHWPLSPPSLLYTSSKTPQNEHWRWSNEQNQQVLHEMTTTHHTPSFSTYDQIPVIQETITTGSSSKSAHNNFHIDEGMRERVHVKRKFALRMKTRLEVIDDGYKWIKYGKKKVKSKSISKELLQMLNLRMQCQEKNREGHIQY